MRTRVYQVHAKWRWQALALVFFALGGVPAFPLWLVSKLGRVCLGLANLFLAPAMLCRAASRGDVRGPYEPRVNRRTVSPKWRVVRGDQVSGEIVTPGRGRR